MTILISPVGEPRFSSGKNQTDGFGLNAQERLSEGKDEKYAIQGAHVALFIIFILCKTADMEKKQFTKIVMSVNLIEPGPPKESLGISFSSENRAGSLL